MFQVVPVEYHIDATLLAKIQIGKSKVLIIELKRKLTNIYTAVNFECNRNNVVKER